MNTASKNIKSPSAPFNPLRSIKVTIGSGILMQGLLFTAISILALYGFYSFQNILENFSEKTFPLTTQEAQSSILMGQLLQQTNILLSSESHQKRRIASHNVKSQFDRIKQFRLANPNSFKHQNITRIDYLEQSIHTLNQSVAKKIDLQNDLYTATTGLILHSQRVHTHFATLTEAALTPGVKTIITSLETEAFNVLLTGLNDTTPTSLFSLKTRAISINALIEKMLATTSNLPAALHEPTKEIVNSIRDALLGENGTISLEKEYLAVINELNNRATFIRSLLENKGDSSMGHFFDLTTSVANDSRLLSDKVKRQIQILSTLFIVSLFLAIGYFIYFQRFLIRRLTSLNKTVLAMVAGENLQVEDDGGDEITEIAHSINYLSTELHEAKSVAERSAVQKSDFLAHMSHEIRTPLNAILGFSDLALMTNSPTEHLDYLSKINNASHSLLGILNSTLDISKIEAGKFTFDKVEFDLRNLLEDLSSIISLKCEESGLKFYYNIEPDTPYKIIGDPLRLSQILTNLVTNAFKFTAEGSITLHISAKNRSPNNKNKTNLLFSVEDTGEGISEEQAQKLFQPFTQADKSITRKFGGTGLGLAICKNLVQMMGGEIWLKQNESKGSTFSFTLPFELVDNTSFFKAPSELANMSAIVMSRTPKSATELSIQLDHFGLSIFQTLSIDEILVKIQETPVNKDEQRAEILFIDCENLSFHWQEAVESFKEVLSGYNNCPLILTGPQRLAAHFHSQDKQVSDYYLVSPVTPARLLDAITTVLDIDNPHCLQKQSIFNPIDTTNSKLHGGATILLVEDNEINSQIAQAYLKSRSLTVISAHNGAEALEILLSSSGNQINAILMDIQMPVMDGYTATKAIRDLDTQISKIPIIALTAHAMPEERQKCLRAGMDAYITKPINANDLYQTLSTFIGEQIPQNPAHNQSTIGKSIPDSLLTKNTSLNMKTGLAQVMNDPALYVDLLISFEKNYREWPNDILSALKLGDLEQCRHLVHTLKGVSGNLGMEKLFSLSVRLELCIRGNEVDSIRQLLDEVEKETGVVCDFLRDWLEQNKNNHWSSEESTDKLDGYSYNIDELTEILSNSLKNNSSKALKQIHLLKSQLGDEDTDLFNNIELHAKELDFDKARDLLTEWQTK